MTALLSRLTSTPGRPVTRLTRSIGAVSCVLASSLTAVGAMPAFALSADSANLTSAEVEFVIDLPDHFYIMLPEPGTVKFLAEEDIPDEAEGRTCSVSLVSLNQHSVHLGNNVILTSGTDSAVIEDVESDPNGTTTNSTDLTLSGSILAELQLGAEGLSSLGFDLGVTCAAQVAPTTIVNTTTSTTPTTTQSTQSILPTTIERCPDGSTPTTDATGAPGTCPSTTTTSFKVLPTILERCPDGAVPAAGTKPGDPDYCPTPTMPPTTVVTTTTRPPSSTTTSQPEVAVRGIQTVAPTPTAKPVAATPTYAG